MSSSLPCNACIEMLPEQHQAFDRLTVQSSMSWVCLHGLMDRLHALRCRNSTVFLPHSPSAVADATAQIRNGFLQGVVSAPGGNNDMHR